MSEIIHAIAAHAAQEWAVVEGAPSLVLLLACLAGATAYGALNVHFKERIDALTATIAQKQSLLDEYKERLNGMTPLEVATEISTLKSEISRISKKVTISQRSITADQKAKIKELLAPNEGDPVLWTLVSSSPDTESSRYSKQIFRALRDAGVGTQWNTLGTHDEGEAGLIFYSPPTPTDPSFVKIRNAFADAGITFTCATDENNPANHYIFVCPEDI
jgi:hypothetical protein